jgi:hypothetical protein
MREALNYEVTGDRQSLDTFYGSIAPIDFSHDVLEVQPTRLQVLRAPNWGWADLGTPQRVEATVRSMGVKGGSVRRHIGANAPLFFDLSGQH